MKTIRRQILLAAGVTPTMDTQIVGEAIGS
jgi:hypothetical protein